MNHMCQTFKRYVYLKLQMKIRTFQLEKSIEKEPDEKTDKYDCKMEIAYQSKGCVPNK